ncbi:aromatic-ring-hydroxylating dioxygenase [Rugosibacter aromaticivorans]|uniref:Aromatic-ring-hydroxylating dioxygenase n=2 Tax=Bacteria TaxID=2 RepID=A0A0C5JCA5_9PROT|nr:aromatic-ring-hydroxylating dioxygenase [Rugosibacter aromaticivorans]TBR14492.1 MAG: 3-phenylpropionate/cinnamic acid dioxygenase subunit beta [Rugosibacter sp.]
MLAVDKHLAVQQHLFYEARLLDDERFNDWLALLEEDIRYRMPVTERRFRKDRSAPLAFGGGYIFDDTKARLAMRVERLQSGLVWAEDPRNKVRRSISNVEIWQGAEANEAEVYSVVSIHRSRIDGEEKHFVAGRRDVWRETTQGWRLALREIRLDNAVVLDSNMNTFF